MKLSGLVTLLPVLLSSSVAYATGTRDVFQARQAHAKKSLVDVCAALDLDVHVSLLGQNILAGHLDICLCLSVLPGFLDSHPVAKKVVDGVGRDGARNYFTGLINNQNGKQECRYPTHARPFCSISCPCDFTCDNGYTASPSQNPTDCVCKPPYSECNGVCGYFPHGCGSQGLSKPKRHDYPSCPAGKTICGVPNGGKGYDCVDIKSDLESCGGCTVASPFGNNVADGKNCKAIPNVEKVLCDGSCKVLSCKHGYKVSGSHDSCVQLRLDRVRQVRGVQVNDIDSLLTLIVKEKLFVRGFDIVAAREKLVVAVKVFNVDHALEVLLIEKAFIEAFTLAELKARLGLDVTVHRRGTA